MFTFGGMLASDWLALSPMSVAGCCFGLLLLLMLMLMMMMMTSSLLDLVDRTFCGVANGCMWLPFRNRAYLKVLKHCFFVLKGRMWWVKVVVLAENLLESRQKTGDFAIQVFFCGQKDCLYYL